MTIARKHQTRHAYGRCAPLMNAVVASARFRARYVRWMGFGLDRFQQGTWCAHWSRHRRHGAIHRRGLALEATARRLDASERHECSSMSLCPRSSHRPARGRSRQRPRAGARGSRKFPASRSTSRRPIWFSSTPGKSGIATSRMIAELDGRGILIGALDHRIRACTHLDVTAAMIEETASAVRQIVARVIISPTAGGGLVPHGTKAAALHRTAP